MKAIVVTRGRGVIRVALGVVVAGTLVGPAAAGRAQGLPAPSLGGFQGVGAASGLHTLYNPANLLPIPPPVDIGAPDAYTTIASGPQTFARASVLDPGDLLANPDAFLSLASSSYRAGTLPAYPFRVSAESGVGAPTAESNPGPGLDARVSATGAGSTAEAVMPAASAPAVATVGSMTAHTTTETDGATVGVTARSEITGFNLLGVVRIDSVVTDLTATSDGTRTTFGGGTSVVGATVLGQAVTIDADGIHQARGSAPLLRGVVGSLTGSLNDILARIGIRVTVSGPVEVSDATAGQRGSDGLRIDMELSPRTLPQLAAVLKAVPPVDLPVKGAPTVGDVLALAKARHLVALELGRGLVSLAARPAVSFPSAEPFTSPAPTGSGSVTGAPSFSPASPPAPPGGDATPFIAAPFASRPATRTSAPGAPIGAGVGALVLLALLASPFVGELLARLGGTVLGAGVGESCTWEEP